ncbi:MAG: hypothetical protein KIT57_21680 [Blastocatellales bacterium]|nr:hypothetical protein [Blastocatellales bacterium]
MRMILEVIACSVRDAVAAAEGGAGRLEIISRLDLGGLTPDPDLVEAILKVVQLPVRVMLRESPGYTIADRAERRRLLDAAQIRSDAGRRTGTGISAQWRCGRRLARRNSRRRAVAAGDFSSRI